MLGVGSTPIIFHRVSIGLSHTSSTYVCQRVGWMVTRSGTNETEIAKKKKKNVGKSSSSTIILKFALYPHSTPRSAPGRVVSTALRVSTG